MPKGPQGQKRFEYMYTQAGMSALGQKRSFVPRPPNVRYPHGRLGGDRSSVRIQSKAAGAFLSGFSTQRAT
jgi:hypothetical protein